MIIKTVITFLFLTNLFALPSDSLYNFEHKWISQDGEVVELKKVTGKYNVLALIYTSCPAACPLMISDLKILDSKLSKALRQKVEYLLISIDPTDTPENLKKFHEKFFLNKRWKFFKGDENSIRELAAATGYKYKKNQDGSYSHSTNVTLLNKDGQIVKTVEFSSEAKNLKSFIK